MRIGLFTFLVLILLALPVGPVRAQDIDLARKKCIEFGFKDKTPSHDTCMEQFLKSTGVDKALAQPTSAKPAQAPVTASPISLAQQEEMFWEDAKAAGNKEAFEAYLANYPRGRYASLARANITRLDGAATAQQQVLPDAAEKLAKERAAFEAEQKLARERAAAEAAPKVSPAEAARRTAANVRPGQVIKDCADCPEMVAIPGGSFVMGADKKNDEKPPHPVTLRSFLMGKTEVTQGQWRAVMGSNLSRFNQCGNDCPVEQVSWNDAQEFIGRLNQKTGLAYRLPSEAEWEYAARAGSSTDWSHGNDESRLADFAWFSTNSGTKAQAVAQKRPNAFGLYDMHGNVWEWVQDCWHDNYRGAPADGSAWTAGCSSNARVLRGGSWLHYPAGLRSAVRSSSTPVYRLDGSGLRLARTP
jgi:formylglycine-generating enzyme required for sulfatase activity